MRVTIDRKQYSLHRLAWFYANGEWPPAEVDHINGNRSDNRLVNLRLASRSINMQNRRTARSDNVSGIIGAHYHARSGRWTSKIQVCGQTHYLGCFATPGEASAAYVTAKRKLHQGCTL